RCARRSQKDAPAAGDEGRRTEMPSVAEAVIGRVGLAETRKAPAFVLPRKGPAVDDRAAQRGPVPAEELGEGMENDVSAMLEGSEKNRGRDRVIYDQRNAVPVRYRCEGFDVAQISGRIADALAVDRARIGINQACDRGRLVVPREAHRYPQTGQEVREQRMGGAVELRHADQVLS